MAATKVVPITTLADGTASAVVHFTGELLAVTLDVGTLSTPDITITDTISGVTVFAKTGIASSGRWQTRVKVQHTDGTDIAAAAGPPVLQDVYDHPVITKSATIAVVGGGNTLSGTLYLTFRG